MVGKEWRKNSVECRVDWLFLIDDIPVSTTSEVVIQRKGQPLLNSSNKQEKAIYQHKRARTECMPYSKAVLELKLYAAMKVT